MWLSTPADQLSGRALARRYGVSEKAIRRRADAEEWGDRPDAREDSPQAVATIPPELAPTAAVLLVALRSVEEHRAVSGALISFCRDLLDDAAKTRAASVEKRNLHPKELATFATFAQRLQATLEGAIAMDRQAYGRPVTASDVLDLCTPEQLASLKAALAQCMGDQP